MAKVYTTPYGVRFKVRKTSDKNWGMYDNSVARTHINNFGIIFCDAEYGTPIDNEYDLEACLQVYKNSN